MNLEQIINSPLIYQLVNDYWKGLEEGRNVDLETECLIDLGIKPYTLAAVEKVNGLFHYNHSFQSNNESYTTLRQGLGEYYQHQIKSKFWNALGIEKKEFHLCDLGAGSAQYSVDFLELNPQSRVTLVDRSGVIPQHLVKQDPRMVGIEVDWEENDEWWKHLVHTFDVILMSEILHQKSPYDRDRLVEIAKSIIKPTGKVVVHETDDPFLGYRLHQLTMDGDRMKLQDVIKVMTRNGFRSADISLRTAHYHHISCWNKER